MATYAGAYGGDGTGNLTATAGTAIQFVIPGSGTAQNGLTRPTSLVYLSGDTGHKVSIARPIGKTTAAAATALGSPTLALTADPGLHPTVVSLSNNLAANDLLAIREVDGVTRLYKVNNIASIASLNLTANLTAGLAAGGKVWNFGLVSDTDFYTGLAHPAIYSVVNVADSFTDLPGSHENDSPILVSSDNPTTAGRIRSLTWNYSRY